MLTINLKFLQKVMYNQIRFKIKIQIISLSQNQSLKIYFLTSILLLHSSSYLP